MKERETVMHIENFTKPLFQLVRIDFLIKIKLRRFFCCFYAFWDFKFGNPLKWMVSFMNINFHKHVFGKTSKPKK